MAQLDTMKDSKFYIAISSGTTPISKPDDIADAAAYAALTWLQVLGVGEIGETGDKDNIIGYDTITDAVKQKQKGITDAGDPVIECRRIYNDSGQIAMRTAADTKNYYAFKIEYADKPNASGTNTIIYQRGLVTGPTRPNGRNESFVLERYNLGLVQTEIITNATLGA